MDSLAAVGCVGLGIAWRWVRWLPSSDRIRRIVAETAFVALLPLLTFRSMARAPAGSVLWHVPLVAALTIGCVLAVAAFWLQRRADLDPRSRAALLLAAAWGNVTYLGIPVLTTTLGPEQVFVAVLFDFTASTPLLWTLGVAVALAQTAESFHGLVWQRVVFLPPLWAAIAGLLWRFSGGTLSPLADGILGFGARAVIPLMMFVLGLSLRWEYLRQWRMLLPVAALKLLVAPVVAFGLAMAVGISGATLRATILEAAMPTMMLVLVVAERFGLATDQVAAAIALTTLASALTLPLWWLASAILA
ncbi:MAG: AEC family transporter [Chlorobiota bacterium]|nr:MAG: AEC family transporter [Chlorobiota bacterium]